MGSIRCSALDWADPTMPPSRVLARFIEPMLLLPSQALPEDAGWMFELKLDGYRALAFKTGGKIHLRSRNNKDFSTKYPAIAKALAPMPDETVIDGEIVALDASGRPSFNALQNHGLAACQLIFYAFRHHDCCRSQRDGAATGGAERDIAYPGALHAV
jgi:bifunctional non-homologous end joining protein LigD